MSSLPIARLLTNAIAPARLAAERHAGSLNADMTMTEASGERSRIARVPLQPVDAAAFAVEQDDVDVLVVEHVERVFDRRRFADPEIARTTP